MQKTMIERLAGAAVDRPRTVIGVVIAITLALALPLAHLQLETRVRDQIPASDPHNVIESLLAKRFGRGRPAVLALEVAEGDIFTEPTLKRLRRLTESLRQVPGVIPATIFSLASPEAKLILPEGDDVRISPVLESVPGDPAALDAIRKAVFAHPMYVGNLVTADGRGTIVFADFDESHRPNEIQAGLEALAAKESAAGVTIRATGTPAVLAAVDRNTQKAAPLFVVAIAVIALVHYEAFRTGQAVVLPLVTALISAVWAMGLLSALGYRADAWTALTAILILSVAAGHAVQILKRYYECYQALGDNRAAVIAAVASTGPAMISAGIVAALGFASLATTDTPSVRNFGLSAAFGIVSALVIELTFIPACRSLLAPPKAHEAAREQSHHLLDGALEWIARFVSARARTVIAAIAAIVLVTSLGMLRLRVDNSLASWFAKTDPLIVDNEVFNERFGGSMTIEISIDADGTEPLLDPAVVHGIDRLQTVLAAEPNIGATISVADYVKTMNRALHGGEQGFYRVPDDRQTIAQYLSLFGAEALGKVVTTDYGTAVIHARARSDSIAWAVDLFERLRKAAKESFPPGIRVGVAGGRLADEVALNVSIVHHKLENMAQVSAVIFVFATVVFGSLQAGLYVLLPVVAASAFTLGLMGWAGSWLTFGTATYAALGISLGADFAIYMIYRLRAEARTRPLEEALHDTLMTSGKAIFFVSSAISAGYATLLLSGFPLWKELGGYVPAMMMVASVTTVMLIPALVLVYPPRFLYASRRIQAPEAAVAEPSVANG